MWTIFDFRFAICNLRLVICNLRFRDFVQKTCSIEERIAKVVYRQNKIEGTIEIAVVFAWELETPPSAPYSPGSAMEMPVQPLIPLLLMHP